MSQGDEHSTVAQREGGYSRCERGRPEAQVPRAATSCAAAFASLARSRGVIEHELSLVFASCCPLVRRSAPHPRGDREPTATTNSGPGRPKEGPVRMSVLVVDRSAES